MPPMNAHATAVIDTKFVNSVPYTMVSLRNARRVPPMAAIDADSVNANSLAPGTLIPSAAAARSFVRTASRRRPLRPRRMLATIRASTTKKARQTMA